MHSVGDRPPRRSRTKRRARSASPYHRSRMKKKPENLLMVADSDHDANMLYAVGMFVPDPFIFLRIRGRDHIAMTDLEIDRARKQAAHCRILSLTGYQKKLREAGVRHPGMPHIIAAILKEKRIRRVAVPHNFP